MGHYDDCRDAHEAVELQERRTRRARLFREVLKNRTDEELGELLIAHEDLRSVAKEMSGTRSQHGVLKEVESVVDRFYRRR